MKKIICCLIAVVLILVFTAATVYAYNSGKAQKRLDELKNVPISENISYVAQCSMTGNLSGCGDGIDYMGILVIKSELSEQEIQTVYNSFDVEKAISADVMAYDRAVHFEELENLSDLSGVYIVFNGCESNNPLLWLFDARGW